MKRDAATEAQVRAARPDASTWLSANAGSGKTRVLTDRVARLLLEDVPPEHILCLTYTKAAATEMQNRLFSRLGGWAMLADDDLRAALAQLGVERALSAEFLRHARTLFARAIEAPGGLRIQTIHSFCAALLRRFPLEAGVSPQFAEMEDRAAQLLRAELLDRMAEGPDAAVLEALAAHVTDQDLETLAAAVVRHRGQLSAGPDEAAIRACYGLAPHETLDWLLADVLDGETLDLLAEVAVHCAASASKTDKALAQTLGAVRAPDLDGLLALERAVLTSAGTLRKSLVTKALATGVMAGLMPRYEALAERMVAARETRLALPAVARDLALCRFAQVFLPAYEAEKLRRGWLDFDDLIDKARALLTDPEVAAWVLYRLDGGIDHILVDEAQDTSPVQWQVIERLAQEITAGEGARADVRRTIFVVGDKKQSIYSFQGADPSEFDRMRADFAERLRTTQAPLMDGTLAHSFRSAVPVLRLVDMTFDGRVASGFGAEALHIAFKDRMPGRVDLWPVVPTIATEEDGEWFEPVDRPAQNHHEVTLARRIAGFIRKAIDDRHPLPVEIGQSGDFAARALTEGDVLILVRRRGRLFHEIIRACKQSGLAIAGADVLRISAELAVRDLGALLAFLATPEDDLSLACALRSPLFGLSEQELFDLAHRRPANSYLWTALEAREEEFPQVVATLKDLREQTDFLRPYDLIERVLTRHDGRRRLLGRLGDEAEDGINALLVQALGYEQSAVPSLTGFLQWMQTDDIRIKRPAESAGQRIRVMTVHGAKGLEAPLVILPDCAQPRTDIRDALLTDDGGLVWKARSGEQPARQHAALDAAKDREAQERDRLLYVAMTRAEKWLVVAAAGQLGSQGEAWYEKVRNGMERSGAVPHVFDFGEDAGGDGGSGEGLQLLSGDWHDLERREVAPEDNPVPDLPGFFARHAPPPKDAAKPLGPSALGGSKALPGEASETEAVALGRGTLVHLLLEHLPGVPAEARPGVAERLMRQAGALPPGIDGAAIVREVLDALAAPGLAALFPGEGGNAEGSGAPLVLTEVPLSAQIAGFRAPMSGILDRLIITSDRIVAVDYKTNRVVPDDVADCPDGLLRQMGAYREMLRAIYPEHAIEMAFVWTAQARYMALPDDLMTQSLEHARLDVGGSPP